MIKKQISDMILLLVLGCSVVYADNINGINMNFEVIDDAGGGVAYNYRIGQTEVSIAQFQDFITADGPDDNYDAYGPSLQAPVVNIDWSQAARYCNWLTSGDVNDGAYTIDTGGTVTALTSHSGLAMDTLVSAYDQVYVLPTKEEWYKAAYYTGSGFSLYANGTGIIPTNEVNAVYDRTLAEGPWDVINGTAEQNGTKNMMGNVWEWQESTFGGEAYDPGSTAQEMSLNGGDWFLGSSFLASSTDAKDERAQTFNIGLRIVAIPEPGTMSLMSLSTVGLFMTRSIRRRKRLGQTLMPVRREHLCDTFGSENEWNADMEVENDDTLIVLLGELKDGCLKLSSEVVRLHQSIDKVFWNRMVIVHERQIARRIKLRQTLRKKALGGFDSFLALIMK